MNERSYFVWLAVVILLAGVVLAACAHEPEAMNAMAVTITPLSDSPPILVSATVPVVHPAPTSLTQQADSCSPVLPDTRPVRYTLEATLDWGSRTMRILEHVAYRNTTVQALGEIVFRVEVNREPGQFALEQVMAADPQQLVTFSLEGARLEVELAQELPVNCSVDITLAYSLKLPPIEDGYSMGQGGYHLGYWGYTPRQVNLGMWFPVVAVHAPSSGWLVFDYHSVGEQNATEYADFDVTLRVENAPTSIRVAGPGVETRLDQQTWQFNLSGGREVALSVAESFQTMSTSTAEGIVVELYYFSDSPSPDLAAERFALRVAADALSLFEELYGPYPHNRLAVVQGDFPDGMEFSGLVYVSLDWFKAWKGVPNDWLTVITAHEVSHQWWYALVGNDQGNFPYLDEALAVYSELLYFERYHPEKTAWWHNFRIERYSPAGYVDTPVYQFYSARGYINAVYLRGGMMIDALRQMLGDDAFFEWLRHYVQSQAGRIAAPEAFWGELSPTQYAATAPIRAEYLQQLNVLLRPGDIP